jgi:outer membrane protein TolC
MPMHRFFTFTLLLALMLALYIPAFAESGAVEIGGGSDTATPQPVSPPDTPATSEEAPVVLDTSVYQIPELDLTGRLPIKLAEALDAVTNESYSARIARASFERSQFDLNLALAPFDVQLQAQIGANSTQRSGTSTLIANNSISSTRSDFYSVDLSQAFPTGDTFSFQHQISRQKISQSGAGAQSIPKSYSAELGLSWMHPLGRGLGRAANYWQAESALNRRPYEQLVYDDTLRNLRLQVYALYYSIVAQRRALEVRKLNLELAVKLLERNYERHKVGLSIRADVLQAENNVLTQKSLLISDQKTYLDQLDQLALLLGVNQKLDIVQDVDISPKETPLNIDGDWPRVVAVSSSLKQSQVSLYDAELNVGYLRNQLKPDLGLNVNYNRSGERGTADAAMRNLDNESYGVSLVYKLPWGKRAYKARLAQGEQDLTTAKVTLQQSEQSLRQDWEALFRELNSKRSQIALSENSVTVAQENFDIQTERNKVGLATTLDVIQAQEALLEAQLGFLRAQVDYQATYLTMMTMVGDI